METIEKLKKFPIWDHAVFTESRVFHKLTAYSKVVEDLLLQEAIAPQAYEEGCHAEHSAMLFEAI